MSQDSYTPAQAAELLGLSVKRVRQLVASGKLKAVPRSSPLKIKAESVHKEREDRGDKVTKSTTPQKAFELASLVEVLELIEAARLSGRAEGIDIAQRQIESAETSRQRTEQALFQLQAESSALAAELAQARARLELMNQMDKKSRGFFRR
jgi:excisionase family DNA binding protein